MGFLGPLPIPIGIAHGPVPAATPDVPVVILLGDEAVYEVWLADDRGTRIALVTDFESLEYAIVANDVGVLTIMMSGDFDPGLINPDWRLDVYRIVRNRVSHEIASFIRYAQWTRNNDGLLVPKVIAKDANYTLYRRRVAYAKKTIYAEKSGLADDEAKAIVRENLGPLATDSDRDLSSLNFSVADDQALGPNIEVSVAWKRVLEALRLVADESQEAGTDLYFGIVPAGDSGELEFRTWINQPGLVVTYPDSARPVLFSPERGNLQTPKLIYDWREEVNYIYAGWTGAGEERQIEEVSDDDRVSLSAWNRNEKFLDGRTAGTVAILQELANAQLAAGRPKIRFEGKVLSTSEAAYGVDWKWGDRVTMEDFGVSFDGVVHKVKIKINPDGRETITAKVVSVG